MSVIQKDLVPEINSSFNLQLEPTLSAEELKSILTSEINRLINQDFEKLVYYLYRIDVNEQKMRKLLDQSEGENAASLIAGLVIERQLQKIKSRQQFSRRDHTNIDENEKW